MNIKTNLRHYRFDISSPADAEAYATLRAEVLEKIGFPVWTMQFHGNYTHDKTQHQFMEKIRASVGPVMLETEHLFANQWNCETLRLFNWSECVYPNKSIKEGYYLIQTDEMRAVLRDTLKCGYCGKQEPASPCTPTFCPHCIDSEYLSEKDLPLTRMTPVCDDGRTRPKALTEAEAAVLLPVWRDAQIHGATERGKARITKKRASIQSDYEKTLRVAKIERDSKLWLIDNAPGVIENHIFYSHTGRHCFGWRTPVDASVLSSLLDTITEFPFPYDIKCADGRTLSGG